ncbi:MAG: ATP-dependent helicase [Burkholderiales bacterium]
MTSSAPALVTAEERILEGLNPAQREAVLHGEGPLLIIAGAGTGKTTVLTRRIAHLIATKRAKPEAILALTFTEKAAAEMAERVDQLIPWGYAETQIATFHAFGDSVLREWALEIGLDPQFRVLSQPEQVIFLRERLFRLPLDRFRPLGDPTRHLQALTTLVSRAKDEDVSPRQYREWAEARLAGATTEEERDFASSHRELAAFYEAYQRLLGEAGLVDFGDQILRTLSLLRERKDALARLRARYAYILVDEFQDTNHAQLEMLGLIAGTTGNLTVVGDDDQAIYRWRGAAAANLLAFRRHYAGAREVVLTENYRSTQVILDAAARLVGYNNPHRLEASLGIDKRLRSPRPSGVPVRHGAFDTVSAEADAVAAQVAERLAQGRRPRDFAILVRSNADADPFLRALNVRGVPHRFSGSRGLYAREEIRLLVSFLKVLANPDDSVALFYLAGSELYRLPETDLLRLNHYARRKTRPLLEVLRELPANEELASVSGRARAAAERLIKDVERAAGEVPRRRTGEVLYGFLQWSGLLAKLAKEASAESEAKVRNIARFFDAVKAYGDVAEHDRVPAFVEHLELLREAGDDPAVAEVALDEDAVHVLTVHKAKGLEFPVVFLVGCAESKFPLQRHGEALGLPSELAKEELDLSGGSHLLEERRLFYVAMTRAMDELVLTSAADYGTSRARKLSRFVVEALDLPSPRPISRKTAPLEALAREAPAPEPRPAAEGEIPEDELLRLSYRQIDDYETCPLKYRYLHVLRVPLLAHHAVVYGHAVHEAVRSHFARRRAGEAPDADALVAAFRAAWVSEGFLSREHEEERLREGEAMLRRFHAQQASDPWRPLAVEQEFAFTLERNRVQGRYDLVLESAGETAVVDFKTGDVRDQKAADRRARESLQLDIYALAQLKTRGRLPDKVELRFLESDLVASRRPTDADALATETRIRTAATAIRKRAFEARPTFFACSQCPFREICPHTAWGEPRE